MMAVNVHRSIVWSVGLAIFAIGVTPIARGQQAPAAPAATTPAAPTPLQLANTAERLRIMKELKISGIPAGAVSSSPDTYNEAEANPYPNLPDPLTMKNGQKVTTAAMWKKRRAEILEDFQREIYGRRPVAPKVTWTVVKTENGTEGEYATVTKQLIGHVDNSAYPGVAVEITATLTTPANATSGVPVIIQVGGGNVTPPPGVTLPPNPCAPPGGFGTGRGAAPPAGARAGGPGGPAAPPGPRGSNNCSPRAGAMRCSIRAACRATAALV
jgi:hypothetical protein